MTDTGNNRILGVGTDDEVKWALSEVPASPLSTFEQPRWACLAGDGMLLVSDHYHHRIVQFRRA